jgi:ubiquitin-conjugating enzyme E2 D
LSLLSDPNPDDPLNPEAAHLYKSNKNMYNQTVRTYVQNYAN